MNIIDIIIKWFKGPANNNEQNHHYTVVSFQPEFNIGQEENYQFEVRKRRPFLLSDVCMSLLLHLSDDFNDDLLLDAIGLLDDD